jgi:hypothetical protein
LAATKPDVLRALARIHAEELARFYKASAKRAGQPGKLHTGAVTFVQRFGSSLNVHVHLHTCQLDGVFVEDSSAKDAPPRFVPAAPLERASLEGIVSRIACRVGLWLKRRGYSKDDTALSNETPEPSFTEQLALLGANRGTVQTLTNDSGEPTPDPDGAETLAPRHDAAVLCDGFNLHASVTVAASDDVGRERLCRYGLRPPFALSRFRMLPDGRVWYRVKKSSRHASRCRVMTPVECIARLCALIPPPRYPLTRFHGVLAPRAKLRPRVVPTPPETCAHRLRKRPVDSEGAEDRHTPRPERQALRDRDGPVVPPEPFVSALTLAHAIRGAECPAPNILSANHLARIQGGLLYAASSNIPWAILLARTFDVDVKLCPRCNGRLEVRAVIHDEGGIRRMLTSLAAHARAPPRSDDPTIVYDVALA